MQLKPFLIAAVFGATALPAMADTASQAQSHFRAIAEADMPALTRDYAADAVFQWVGGPLDGVYAGRDAIAAVWQKFTQANGPVSHRVKDLRLSENPKGATVTADVEFHGKQTIPVRYILTYRGGKLVNEVWQIDPRRAAAY